MAEVATANLHIGYSTNASVYIYSLMYTVALTVDALVVVDTPESTLINTEVKKRLMRNKLSHCSGLSLSTTASMKKKNLP